MSRVRCFRSSVRVGVLGAAFLAASLGVSGCATNGMNGSDSRSAGAPITTSEVRAAQRAWAEGIEDISQVYMDDGDYRARARQLLETLYGYEDGTVLFKPTLAAEDQFRETFAQALSYFVGGVVAEDGGFAIKPWSNARFGEQEMILMGDTAVAMGNYYFTPAGENQETKVEFTFGYYRDDEGNLRINVHHSSLPYSP